MQITRLFTGVQVLWTASLVIAGDHFNLPPLFVLVCIGKHMYATTMGRFLKTIHFIINVLLQECKKHTLRERELK